jgi:hypothetical protein
VECNCFATFWQVNRAFDPLPFAKHAGRCSAAKPTQLNGF